MKTKIKITKEIADKLENLKNIDSKKLFIGIILLLCIVSLAPIVGIIIVILLINLGLSEIEIIKDEGIENGKESD